MAGTRSGFNSKTVADLKRDGTFRKDRHGDLRNPEAPAGRPEMPDGLSNAEQSEWDSLMLHLEMQGSAMTVDGKAAYQYVKLFCETESVAEQRLEAQAGLRVLEENLSTRPETPEERLSASDKVQLFAQIVTLHKLISKCTDQLRSGRMAIRQYLVEFGLTPASRGRIKLTTKAEPVDDFAQRQRQRPTLSMVRSEPSEDAPSD